MRNEIITPNNEREKKNTEDKEIITMNIGTRNKKK